MVKFTYKTASVPEELKKALKLIEEDFPIGEAHKPLGIEVAFTLSGGGPGFKYNNGKAAVSGSTICQVLRALASLRGFAIQGNIPAEFSEDSQFQTLGLMLDVSRNSVFTVDTVKFLLRRMALMGMNTLMLYTEDTYEVPGQPFIGYMRGRYTQAELKKLDDYADALGIEMFPCIQALGHMGQALRWPAFDGLRDTSDILLAEEPKTYQLLRQMIEAACAPYRSKRIHIGMDEAHGLGEGTYRKLHGQVPRFDIMNKHLAKVVEITDDLGLHPMIWSDMYFRLGSKTNDYYDKEAVIPPDVAKKIPPQAQLIYWDYYHFDENFYLDWIDRHRAMGCEPIFAGGLWTWTVFWLNFARTKVCTDAAMSACKKRGVKEAITTAWGDDGNEVDMLSMLPGLQYFAEHGYNRIVSDEVLGRNFLGNLGDSIDDWNLGTLLDDTPGTLTIGEYHKMYGVELAECVDSDAKWVVSNPSKYLLWEDPLLGLFDEDVKNIPFAEHYKKLSKDLKKALGRVKLGRPHLEFAKALADVMEVKSQLGRDIVRAYKTNDNDALTYICEKQLPKTIRKTEAMLVAHRKLWFSVSKPEGWEVIDTRYGALLARLRSAKIRLSDYLDGRISTISELEEDRLRWSSVLEGILVKELDEGNHQSGKDQKIILPPVGYRHRQIISPSIVV